MKYSLIFLILLRDLGLAKYLNGITLSCFRPHFSFDCIMNTGLDIFSLFLYLILFLPENDAKKAVPLAARLQGAYFNSFEF